MKDKVLLRNRTIIEEGSPADLNHQPVELVLPLLKLRAHSFFRYLVF